VVRIENASSKTVVAVLVLTAIAAPEGCSRIAQRPFFIQESDGRKDSLDASLEIPPHSAARLRSTGLYSRASSVRTMKSRYLQIQLGVARVKFKDGTSWTSVEFEKSNVFDPALLQVDSAKCAYWPWIDGMLDNVQQVHVSAAPQDFAPAQAARYTFFCEVKGNTAFCIK
jgi:hypothetical protein